MKTFSIINSIFYDNIYREHGKYKIKTDKPLTNFLSNRFNDDNKFFVYDKFILESPFVTSTMKTEYCNIFYKSQKIYHILCRFVRRYKVAKSIKYGNDVDLCLNNIVNITDKAVFKLYVDKSRVLYTFRISDLIQVINAALTYNTNFFAEPQKIKNP